MNSVGRLSVVVVALWACGAALAAPNDLRLFQLGNPREGGFGHVAGANGNFRAAMRQLGAAISSANLGPPETLGYSGFAVSGEMSWLVIGDQKLPTERTFEGQLGLVSAHVRKGLPFSMEVGARVGAILESSMWAATLEYKWALNEGFAYLPDIGVRGHVTKLLNGRDFDLTVGGLDLGVGKQFAIGGMVTLTPYVGWNLAFTGASSGNVDFRPDRSLQEADTPNTQFKDVTTFDGVFAYANTHNRFYGGVRFIGGALMVGFEISYALIGKFSDASGEREVPGVLGLNTTLGLDF